MCVYVTLHPRHIFFKLRFSSTGVELSHGRNLHKLLQRGQTGMGEEEGAEGRRRCGGEKRGTARSLEGLLDKVGVKGAQGGVVPVFLDASGEGVGGG